ncbi:hypothetical protein HGRIS_004327 [Hohenbuehelia grisea]|uniref:Uncharacterized protein n=1 Tax=Hohenbuehelia grisea TaxID=104357 RepID=A0ABR3IPG4_9AGAR
MCSSRLAPLFCQDLAHPDYLNRDPLHQGWLGALGQHSICEATAAIDILDACIVLAPLLCLRCCTWVYWHDEAASDYVTVLSSCMRDSLVRLKVMFSCAISSLRRFAVHMDSTLFLDLTSFSLIFQAQQAFLSTKSHGAKMCCSRSSESGICKYSPFTLGPHDSLLSTTNR